MKINEFKRPKSKKVNEGWIDDLGAAYGGKASGSRADNLSDLFFKDFTEDARVSLDSGISGGLVDISDLKKDGPDTPPGPDAVSGKPADKYDMMDRMSAASKNKKSAPPSGKFAGKPAANVPIDPTKKNAATTDPYENLKGQMRRLQPQPGKTLPTKFASELSSDMAKLSKGDKDHGAYAADKIMKYAKAGYDVSKLAPAWNASSEAGERFLTQSIYREINNMLKEHGLTWGSLGLRIRLYEGIGNSGIFISRSNQKTTMTDAEEFRRLNQIFESIMEAGHPDPTISEYMMSWFGKYMDPVNWNKYQSKIKSLTDQIQSTYNKDKGEAAIGKLARMAFSIAQSTPQAPAGMRDEVDKPGVEAPDPKLKPIIDGLAKLSPEQREQLKKILNSKK